MGGRAGGGASGGMGSRSRGGASSWPTLTGSEKQVSWANDIRSGAQKALDFIKPYATNPQAKAVVAGWEKKMQGMTSAKQWIDSRYSAPKATYPVSAGDKAWEAKYNQGQAKSVLSAFSSWLGT